MSIEKIERELREAMTGVENLHWETRGVFNLSSSKMAAADAFTDLCSPENIRALLDELSRLRQERDEALAEIERMTPKFVAYEYLESPAGREIAEARVFRLEKALEAIRDEPEVHTKLNQERLCCKFQDIAARVLSEREGQE